MAAGLCNLLKISPEERMVRQELAALYRLVAYFGMSDIIYTHISARIPGKPGRFLINQYGMLFHEICASSLVEVNEEGIALSENHEVDVQVNPAGFNIHAAVHAGRPDINFVLHTHTRAGAAVSCQKQGLLPISQQALMFYNRLGYHDYEGFALDVAERQRLIADLGENKGLVLRNHGLLVVGRNAAEAFNRIYILEKACDIQIAALSGGAELAMPAHEVMELTGDLASPEGVADWECLAWQAVLRLLDNQPTDYRS
ncbi:class II aldolase [Komagataeibacter rhaeticus]|uniref:class II aldolase/adducin family protein n=1 Tax=Komagataeibacter rhaeticus TaxID=215221 RepID=UPI000D93EC40|nr:class II aldolase/adducin family protein [Komagataeibacter rhaeticus]MBL7239235.1 class II aldolase/adducin family protein [Komagataeibacter rhaeticus]PYD52509.1 class II aldolase [Komagataeibacter rhaeticus]